MEEDWSHKTEKLLNLTLEIIYLLTGENVTFTMPPCDSLKPEGHNRKKIIDVTKRMIDMLAEESENPSEYNIIVKEEFIEEDGMYGVMEKISEGHKNIIETPKNRNSLARCPNPLYSQGSTQKDPHHDQGDNRMTMKAEVNVRKMYMLDDRPYTEEAEKMRTNIKDTPTKISTGHTMEKTSKDTDCRKEDSNQLGDCSGVNTVISVEGGSSSVDKQLNPWDSEHPHTVKDGPENVENCESQTPAKPHSCPECGKCFSTGSLLVSHQRFHTEEKPFLCSQCGESFKVKSELIRHQSYHTEEKPYSCPECGKRYFEESDLVTHLRSHSREKPYSCSECGNSFVHKSKLVIHLRSHTGEKPYCCPECGKSFLKKSHLVLHLKYHTGEKTYFCPECGKGFRLKAGLVTHLRSHTGEKPYSCTECDKRYSCKSQLVRHQKIHIGVMPYSCSECGKCFTEKYNLSSHKKCHMKDFPKAW